AARYLRRGATWLRRCEFRQHGPQPSRKRRVRALELGRQRGRDGVECTSQLRLVERPDERRLDWCGELRRQQVGALRVASGMAEAQAGEREHVVTDPADEPLGLPELAALDARARVQ